MAQIRPTRCDLCGRTPTTVLLTAQLPGFTLRACGPRCADQLAAQMHVTRWEVRMLAQPAQRTA